MFRPRFVALGIALATLLVFLPVRDHEFITYDDPDYVTENPMVQAGLTLAGVQWAFTTFHANNWHPLTWLSHMLDCTLFGLDSGVHHLVSVLLHSANAVLLFLLLVRMTDRVGPASVVAALFAWHPMHVQSVAWVSERKDVLSTLFMFLALWAYVRSRATSTQHPSPNPLPNPSTETNPWNVASLGSLLLFTLGLFAKPMLVTLPFVLVLLDFWPLRRASFSPFNAQKVVRLFVEKWPFFLLTVASCVVTFEAQRAQAVVALAPHPLSLRVANAVLSYGTYLWKLLWPVELAVIYPLSPKLPWGAVALSGIVLAGFTAAAIKWRTTKPHLLVGWFWFLGTLVPVIGIVQVGGQAFADRYTYVPYVGIFIALAFEIADSLQARARLPHWPAPALSIVILLACVAVTSWQLTFWQSSERLFRRTLQVTGENAVALANLGIALESKGRNEEALDFYLRATRANPSLVQAHNNAANLLDAGGRTDEAVRHYRESLRLKPNAALAHANLAGALSRSGRNDEAQKHFSEALRLAPRDPRVPYLIAKSLLRSGRAPEAVAAFNQALAIDPNHLQTLTFLARTLTGTDFPDVRNPRQAVELAERAAVLTASSDPFVLETLAVACAEAGDQARALRVLEAAIEISKAQGDAAGVEALEKRRSELQSKPSQ